MVNIKHNKLYILLAILSIYIVSFLYKSQFGYITNDEAFYLGTAYRLIEGDKLLIHEWNPSQFSSLLMYPILKVYLLLVGNTDGIFRVFRYLYMTWQIVIAFLSFYMLKDLKIGNIKYIIILLYLMYTPYGIMGLGYNTMGLSFVYLLMIMLVSGKLYDIKYQILFGIILSLAVICNPYLALVYFIYALCVIIFNVRHKYNNYIFEFKIFRNITLSICGVAILFLVVVFKGLSIEDILFNIGMILNDPTHQQKTLYDIIFPLYAYIYRNKFYLVPLFILFVVGLVKKEKRVLCFELAVVLSVITQLYFGVFKLEGVGFSAMGINTIMLILTPLGFISYFYMDKKDNRYLVLGWLLGIIYAFSNHLASDQGMHVISMGCSISSSCSLLMVYNYFKDNDELSMKKYLLYVIIASQLFVQFNVWFSHIYWDKSTKYLTYEIEEGSWKGVKTTEEKYIRYHTLRDDMAELGLKVKEKVLYFTNLPYAYIENNNTVASYSTWGNATSLYDFKFNEYFKANPNHVPNYIFVDYLDVNDEIYEYANDFGYDVKEASGGSVLLSKVKEL